MIQLYFLFAIYVVAEYKVGANCLTFNIDIQPGTISALLVPKQTDKGNQSRGIL